MRKLIPLLLLTLSLPAFAQSVLNIDTQECVWRSGDDLSWAAQNLNETGWQPNPHWQGLPDHARIWVRCHADLSSLRTVTHPAIQGALYGAYQLFLNGESIGGAGDVRSGVFSMNVIQQFPVAAAALGQMPATIALRITYRPSGTSFLTLQQDMDPPEIHAGDLGELKARRTDVISTDSNSVLVIGVCHFVIGVLGLTLLGLFYYDRSRIDLLYLSLLSVGNPANRVNQLCAAFQMNYSSTLYFAAREAGQILIVLTFVLFFFALARRRVAPFYWVLLAIVIADYSLNGITLLLPLAQALWLYRWAVIGTSLPYIAWLPISIAPFVAFWPYTRIARRMRPLAALCMLRGVCDLVWFITLITNDPQLGLPNLYRQWGLESLKILTFVQSGMLVAMFGLLFRDQHEVTEERAVLAGEMQAASKIQRMLAPASIETAPGLHIEVAFHPMREVGGDFYQCRVLPNGTQRVLLGDVSGKGSAAAMTAALLLGGAADQDSLSPAALLAHLNRVLIDSRVGGFATCLCADFSAKGQVTLANAGHLAPYLRGEEFSIPSGLPLALEKSPDAYHQFVFNLAPSDTITFISDGVVEARDATGELFGFERACTVSGYRASKIAEAAQSFGQEDDITVLTLTFAPAGVAHA